MGLLGCPLGIVVGEVIAGSFGVADGYCMCIMGFHLLQDRGRGKLACEVQELADLQSIGAC